VRRDALRIAPSSDVAGAGSPRVRSTYPPSFVEATNAQAVENIPRCVVNVSQRHLAKGKGPMSNDLFGESFDLPSFVHPESYRRNVVAGPIPSPTLLTDGTDKGDNDNA